MEVFVRLVFLPVIASCVLLLYGCARYAPVKNLDNIALLMSKEEVIKKLKGQGTARGSILNKFGQTIEVREYKMANRKTGEQVGGEVAVTLLTFGLAAPVFFSQGEVDTYWLYFCDGKLVQWGKAGDWAEAQKMVYDINFKMS